MADFTKLDGESYPVGVDFTGKLPRGTELVSGTATSSPSGLLASGTATIDKSRRTASVQLDSGSGANTYTVTLTVTLDDASTLIDTFTVEVT